MLPVFWDTVYQWVNVFRVTFVVFSDVKSRCGRRLLWSLLCDNVDTAIHLAGCDVEGTVALFLFCLWRADD